MNIPSIVTNSFNQKILPTTAWSYGEEYKNLRNWKSKLKLNKYDNRTIRASGAVWADRFNTLFNEMYASMNNNITSSTRDDVWNCYMLKLAAYTQIILFFNEWKKLLQLPLVVNPNFIYIDRRFMNHYFDNMIHVSEGPRELLPIYISHDSSFYDSNLYD